MHYFYVTVNVRILQILVIEFQWFRMYTNTKRQLIDHCGELYLHDNNEQ